jgi:hypothetical protein
MVPGVRRSMPTDPGDATGMTALSIAYIDGIIIVVWIAALGSRLRRWVWRQRHP